MSEVTEFELHNSAEKQLDPIGEIREVDVLWKNRTSAMVRGGLAPGEKLITSPLSFASEGMPVAEVNNP